MKVLIIGGVAGGAGAAARLRRRDENAQIILFEKGPYISYANCGLPYYIGGAIKERERLFVQTLAAFAETYNVDVRINTEITALDVQRKTVTASNLLNGQSYFETYDKLVISSGAEPIRPPIPGIDLEDIFTLRNLRDSDHIKAYLEQKKPKSAVVVGGGFIGLEMVENLNDAGLKVCVIEKANQVMAPLDFTMANQVHGHLKQKGVGLLLEEGVKAFERNNGAIKLLLESGNTISADMVLLSIGVKPDVRLAQAAGLMLGALGGIRVDEYMLTSEKDIYALGDAVEVYNPVIGKNALIALAGPANKQARIVADNIVDGPRHKYNGTVGTSIAKVFDLSVAAAGASSKLLQREKIEHLTSFINGHASANYYPGAMPLAMAINFSPHDGKLLGAQVVGFAGVDKRIDLLAQVIKNGGSIYDLREIEHAYAPPYASAKDPVNMAGYVADNILNHRFKAMHWWELRELEAYEALVLDIRVNEEYELGHIPGALNIPLAALRKRLAELPKDKKIVVYCSVGLRAYMAARILLQNGFSQVYSLSGGYTTYAYATAPQSSATPFIESPLKSINADNGKDVPINMPATANASHQEPGWLSLDARGLPCPGPIMMLKKNYDQAAPGDKLRIQVTDQGFVQDLEGWSKMVGARLLSMDSHKGVISALIEKNAATGQAAAEAPASRGHDKTLIVFSDNLDRALASFVIANGAAAAGRKVTMFFTFWGLNVIKKTDKPKVSKDIWSRLFSIMLPSDSSTLSLSKMNLLGLGACMMRFVMKKRNIESLETLMQQAIANGVEMIACSMSMDAMGIKKEELLDNALVGGVAAYLSRAENADMNLFI